MERSTIYGSFTVERRYEATPERIFDAWSDPEQVRQWSAPVEGWTFEIHGLDFRVGGGEHFEFGPKNGPQYTLRSRFDDIVPGKRIVSVYSMAEGDRRISSSIMCVELTEEGDTTLLRLTEHGLFLDGCDRVEDRRGGALQTLAQLQALLALKTLKAPAKPKDGVKSK